MENTPKKVAKPRLQLVISVLVATSLILAELYVMINQPANVVLMIGIAVLVLIAVYFVIDAVMDCAKEKEIVTREQYDNIYRSEKASYMLLRKNLEEISHLIQDGNANSQTDNTEEIVNAQKALAKISVSKGRENAEMIVAKIADLERALEGGLAGGNVSGVDAEKQDRLFIELNNLEASLNDRLQGLSDKLSGFQEEIERLADHIAKINTEAISEAVKTTAVQTAETENEDLDFADLDLSDISISEESDELGLSAFADISDIEIPDVEEVAPESEEDILSQLVGEMESLEEVSVEEPAEEKPAAPDMSNPNKMMTPEEIAALIANM